MEKSNKELAVELVCSYYSNPKIDEPFEETRIRDLILLAMRALEKADQVKD